MNQWIRPFVKDAYRNGWYRPFEMTQLNSAEFGLMDRINFREWKEYHLYYPHDTQPTIIIRAESDETAWKASYKLGTTKVYRRELYPVDPPDPQE